MSVYWHSPFQTGPFGAGLEAPFGAGLEAFPYDDLSIASSSATPFYQALPASWNGVFEHLVLLLIRLKWPGVATALDRLHLKIEHDQMYPADTDASWTPYWHLAKLMTADEIKHVIAVAIQTDIRMIHPTLLPHGGDEVENAQWQHTKTATRYEFWYADSGKQPSVYPCCGQRVGARGCWFDLESPPRSGGDSSAPPPPESPPPKSPPLRGGDFGNNGAPPSALRADGGAEKSTTPFSLMPPSVAASIWQSLAADAFASPADLRARLAQPDTLVVGTAFLNRSKYERLAASIRALWYGKVIDRLAENMFAWRAELIDAIQEERPMPAGFLNAEYGAEEIELRNLIFTYNEPQLRANCNTLPLPMESTYINEWMHAQLASKYFSAETHGFVKIGGQKVKLLRSATPEAILAFPLKIGRGNLAEYVEKYAELSAFKTDDDEFLRQVAALETPAQVRLNVNRMLKEVAKSGGGDLQLIREYARGLMIRPIVNYMEALQALNRYIQDNRSQNVAMAEASVADAMNNLKERISAITLPKIRQAFDVEYMVVRNDLLAAYEGKLPLRFAAVSNVNVMEYVKQKRAHWKNQQKQAEYRLEKLKFEVGNAEKLQALREKEEREQRRREEEAAAARRLAEEERRKANEVEAQRRLEAAEQKRALEEIKRLRMEEERRQQLLEATRRLDEKFKWTAEEQRIPNLINDVRAFKLGAIGIAGLFEKWIQPLLDQNLDDANVLTLAWLLNIYQNGGFRVPSKNEAENQDAFVDALIAFVRYMYSKTDAQFMAVWSLAAKANVEKPDLPGYTRVAPSNIVAKVSVGQKKAPAGAAGSIIPTNFKWKSVGGGSCAFDSLFTALFKVPGTWLQDQIFNASNVRPLTQKCNADEFHGAVLDDIIFLQSPLAERAYCLAREAFYACVGKPVQWDDPRELLSRILTFYRLDDFLYDYKTLNAQSRVVPNRVRFADAPEPQNMQMILFEVEDANNILVNRAGTVRFTVPETINDGTFTLLSCMVSKGGHWLSYTRDWNGEWWKFDAIQNVQQNLGQGMPREVLQGSATEQPAAYLYVKRQQAPTQPPPPPAAAGSDEEEDAPNPPEAAAADSEEPAPEDDASDSSAPPSDNEEDETPASPSPPPPTQPPPAAALEAPLDALLTSLKTDDVDSLLRALNTPIWAELDCDVKAQGMNLAGLLENQKYYEYLAVLAAEGVASPTDELAQRMNQLSKTLQVATVRETLAEYLQ